MKFFRAILIPVLCFIMGWGITFFVSREKPSPDCEEPTVARRSSSVRMERSASEIRKITLEKLTADFKTQPMSEWPQLWEKFATKANVADLTAIPYFAKRKDGSSVRRTTRNLLHMLAMEELAIRSELPLAAVPGAYAVLAENDPEAAWRRLARNNRIDLAIGVVRTLARRDPAGTLARLLSMPKCMQAPDEFVGEGGMNSGTPLAAIFAAWTRQNPEAAAAAMMKLPRSERPVAIIAETWAYQDGPAAVRFITDFIEEGGEVDHPELRMESILRASFARHPQETAKLIAADAKLRAVMADGQSVRIRKLWQVVDPAAALRWTLEEQAGLFMGEGMDQHITLPEGHTVYRTLINDDPEAECDRWLVELRRHRDPALALTALGWTQEMATALATLASRVFPQKAAELAKLLPASALDAMPAGSKSSGNLRRYWPDLALLPETPPPSNANAPLQPFPEGYFKHDPAAAAEMLLSRPMTESDVTQAVPIWAPHDLAGVKAWIARIPDAELRKHGEWQLLPHRVATDPVGVLEMLVSQKRSGFSYGDVWTKCLRRLVATGGDWQGWLARIPGDPRECWVSAGGDIHKVIAAEARLLELVKNPVK